MKLLITGSKGQLGSELGLLAEGLPQVTCIATDSKSLNITDGAAVAAFVQDHAIDVIVNCAAYTAVDQAETDKDAADAVNCDAVAGLAQVAADLECKLIHISTDYVFDGAGCTPYLATDPTSPVNYYGASKLKGEQAMQRINPANSLILRTSWVYSSFGNNFVKTMLRLGSERERLNVIYDQVGVPTYARDLARFILEKAIYTENPSVNIYQYTNEGVCSWYDFAYEIMRLAGLDCKVYPIPTSAYPTPAKRPHYSLMDKEALKAAFDTEIPYWKSSLTECVQLLNNH
ncbi:MULTISPECIES: dTDP-4-dehydrorhamnose reductase [Leeuwenhoekiella]|uniref:dTDP-4-dehydrorhamnose reductase n=2 Tax=Flavobacteriaceae TaxID=49546 RepID=UPI000C3DC630|nr:MULTISPECIES: dTDP-4-dehydrorhamnose reductase [Leeuwenhoekiella]MAO44985.1 dTDP-4-dehydrorhamnose reductase [Leeuwenhoekiella sp.]|tara:strand:+ start:9018 stop:9881 length:864 start_codon:yes stop_codon:yes gene_type:complete